jgi:hypothetical protein
MAMANDAMGMMTQACAQSWEQGVFLWRQQAKTWVETMKAAGGAVSIGDITFNIYYPFGQGYQQDIDPQTNWGWIGSSATNWPEIEEEIVRRVASYGAQLDTIMELLLDVARKTPDADAEKIEALEDLFERIKTIKTKYGRT